LAALVVGLKQSTLNQTTFFFNHVAVVIGNVLHGEIAVVVSAQHVDHFRRLAAFCVGQQRVQQRVGVWHARKSGTTRVQKSKIHAKRACARSESDQIFLEKKTHGASLLAVTHENRTWTYTGVIVVQTLKHACAGLHAKHCDHHNHDTESLLHDEGESLDSRRI
jgi:hypothetical protein